MAAPEHSSKLKLRDALAIHRAMELFQGFRPQSNVTRTQWAGYLEDLYRRIFDEIYADSHVVSPEERLSGLVESPRHAGDLSAIFSEFARRFFDANGFFAATEPQEAAAELATLYRELMRAAIFPYGNSLVTRIFFTLMGEMRGFREKLGGVDFRRLSSEEVEVLRAAAARPEALTGVFFSALSHRRDPHYPGNLTPYTVWPDHSVVIAGARFLELPPDSERITLKKKIAEPVIVLINGRLVPRSRFEALLAAHSGMLGAFRIAKSEEMGELAGLDRRYRTATILDATEVSESAPPVVLSLHPFTHLTYPEHHRLEEYLRQEYAKDYLELEDAAFAEQVVTALTNVQAKAILSLAAGRIQRIATSLRSSIAEELKARQKAEAWPGQPPQFVMTMGGSGSGKNSSRYFNRHYREENRRIKEQFVYASLDDGRPLSDLYPILIAAGQHADDYEAVHLWADTRRRWLCEEAKKRRMNVIFDGSGIHYAGRYDAIVAEFAEAGYRTKVVAADCLLLVPESRRSEFPESAIDRIIKRAKRRTLPWRVSINKHIGFPASLLAAFTDANLDRLVVIDNAGGPETDRVMAELATVTDAVLEELEAAEGQGRLVTALARHRLLPEGCEATELREENTGFLLKRVGGKNRLLVIADRERMVDIIEKGQLNPNAHGPETLAWLKRPASFLIDRIDKPHGIPTIPPRPEGVKKPADRARSNYLRLNGGQA